MYVNNNKKCVFWLQPRQGEVWRKCNASSAYMSHRKKGRAVHGRQKKISEGDYEVKKDNFALARSVHAQPARRMHQTEKSGSS